MRERSVSPSSNDCDVRDPLVAPDVVDGEDVGVREGSDGASLAFEPLAERPVALRVRRQGLDGHLSLQPHVPRTIHLAHTAVADGVDDFVWA
jgi:hypothetical protein